MKRLSITILALLISFVASAQVPYKIHNNKLYLIWNGDTLKFKIYGDSTSIGGGNRLNFSHDSLYFPHLATGATDTNIMFVRGSDGKMMYLRPADIGIGNSYWSKNGSIHPTDTTNAVAIGTNSAPAGTMLRVNDGAVLFDGSTGTTPVSGAGTRMMWIPSKGAFRAGTVSATQWDDASIGSSSVAFGNDSYAPGASSFAGGRGKAYGAYSFAWGDSCRTSTAGSYGVAMGYGNKVTASYGGVIGGRNNTSSGIGTVVLGGQNIIGSKDSSVYVPNLNVQDTLFWNKLSPAITMYDFINIEDYGAIGDGITDNTTFIQLAVNAASAQNKSIYIPEGTFLISGSVNVTHPMDFVGTGNRVSVIKLGNTYGFLAKNALGINYRNIGFLGTGIAASDAQSPVFYWDNSNGIVDNCYFDQIGGSAIYISTLYQIVATNNIFNYCDVGANFYSGERMKIIGNTFNYCTIGISLPGEYSITNDNIFYHCATAIKMKAPNQVSNGNSMYFCTTGYKYLYNSLVTNAHSLLSNNMVNHSTYAFDIDSVTMGVTIANCYSWVSDIILRKSKGIKFDACSFDSGTLYLDGSISEMNNCQIYRTFTIIDDYNSHKSYNRIVNNSQLGDSLEYVKIKSDHKSDTSFSIESYYGKLMTILDNGTAYIGDRDAATDPIMTVSTTDSTTTLIGILKLTPQDDPPVSASEGMIYADTDHHLYYYNGTAWVQLD